MKLILRADVEHLGRLGDVVTVKPGYGRNFLIPRGLAMQATAGNLKVFESERRKLAAKRDAARGEAASFADKLASAKVVISVRVGEGDKLYGAVTSSNIVDALAALGIELDRKKIVLHDPIRAVGVYAVPVKLHPDVTAAVSVTVMPIGSQAAAALADEPKPAKTEDGDGPVAGEQAAG
ncbi:MAG: 50S ribosomal protein L9 [Desulfovibrionaceae bacterium]|nr:50S ribosomal protein L9 [Desulfovibrionaceae bacterium]MBF0514715.1 50S ribosomal protein L9 [Desulfovibrionaceae bacterium]